MPEADVKVSRRVGGEERQKKQAKTEEQPKKNAAKLARQSSWMPSKLIWSLAVALFVYVFVAHYPMRSEKSFEEEEKLEGLAKWKPAKVSAEAAAAAVQLYRQGNAFFKDGDTLQAEQHFERAVATDPGHSFAWANLGNVLRDRQDYSRAIQCHERAYQLSPQRPRSAYNLAVSLQTDGKYEAAYVLYKQTISLAQQDNESFDVSRAHTNLGVCLQGMGQLEEAAEQYALAKKINPDLRSANLNYCNIMLPLKGSDAAIGCFSALLDRDPSFEQALSAAAGVHHLAENLGAAQQLYRRALAENPSSASAQHGLASISGGGSEVAPPEYVRDMFNGYALSFDASLQALRYQSPELLRRAIDRLLAQTSADDSWAARAGSWRVMDAGCGTGLCGPLLRNLSSSITGVDLSENMVALAKQRGVYDTLKAVGGDVVVAADVLVYIGNLTPFLEASANAVRARKGLVAFTTEVLRDEKECLSESSTGWKLTTSGRYAHCEEYVTRAALATGMLHVVRAENITPRWNRGKPVQGSLFLLRAL